MKILTTLALALLLPIYTVTSALAFPANHDYTVQLSTIADNGQKMAVEQVNATSDADGKLTFQFSQVPDKGTAPFLLVEVMDAAGTMQVVRQAMVPAPAPGQALQLGVNETSHRQATAALRAFTAAGHADAGRAMFALMLVPGGAVSPSDADAFGQLADDAETTFESWLTQAGVTAAEMDAFRAELMTAMQNLAGACRGAVQQTDPVVAAGMHGTATGQFMQAVIDAGTMAGIDPELMATAFDQAGQMIDNSPLTDNLSPSALDAMHASFMVDGQQRQLHAEMSHYRDAMMVVGATAEQQQSFTAAMTALQKDLYQARHDFQMIFADPTNLPDQATIDQARLDMEEAMQAAFDAFHQATTATDTAVSGMLDGMAGQMPVMSGGMMGSAMMTGSDLAGMGFGRWQVSPDGTTGNWSTMMVAAGNLMPQVPGMTYVPDTTALENQLAQLPPLASPPVAPDWTQLADGPYKSVLQLQYDLMLENLVMEQTRAGMAQPLSAADQARLSELHHANLQAIHQGLSGLTETRADALMTVMTPPHLL
ncbi:hypothetical protein C2E25_12290 [Geothermobacter hydrogeniphilus]|uniref:DUF4175 domain-containing protein n=1 Tax=Geothermobacter hydrogeniphilus TaxID=1969733 RepID=A0A2K2H879_9BACT|nr:hypothetical protein [Geothermobacter hydrogeniphilus]PNU19514.1 hypothetical protein C2E25_12290 [Geothermobacter hydrogeniphilus]